VALIGLTGKNWFLNDHSLVRKSESAIVVSGFKPIMTVYGLAFLLVYPLIEDRMLPMVLFGESAQGEFWMEAAVDAKSAYLIPPLSSDVPIGFELDLEGNELHGVGLSVLHVVSPPL
jgi:hypothetical protein